MAPRRRAQRRTHLGTDRRRRPAARVLGAAMALALGALVPAWRATPAGASTLTVTDLADGMTPGTLRWAVSTANATPGPDEIEFDASLDGTITLTGGQLLISDDLLVVGSSSVTVSGGGTSGVLAIDGSGAHLDVTLVFLRVTDGSAPAGGAIAAVDADLHVIVCDLGTNEAVDGGAISAVGVDLTVVNTIFQDNHASGTGGAIDLQGPTSSLTMTGSNVVGNTAATGGGIATGQGAGDVDISGSHIHGNAASDDGGGLAIVQPSLPVTLHDTAIYDNTAGDTGGGVVVDASAGAVTLSRTTLSGNTAVDGAGLAVAVADGPITVQEMTITGNVATGSGGGVAALAGTVAPILDHVTIAGNAAAVGGGLSSDTGRVIVGNSIVADNTAGLAADLAGATFDLDHALVEDAAGATLTSTGFDVVGADPHLGPLVSVPGFLAQAFFPGPASPALDTAGPSSSSADQRGVARPAGAGPDMGSIEVSPGAVAFAVASTSVAEAGGSVSVEVGRVDGDDFAASVDYSVASSTADAGDYTATAGTLTWTDGDATPRTIVVPVTDDETHEGDETFVVVLSGAHGAALAAPSLHTVTIVDDDVAPPPPAPPAPPAPTPAPAPRGTCSSTRTAPCTASAPRHRTAISPRPGRPHPSGSSARRRATVWVLDDAGDVFAFGDATWQGNARADGAVALVGHAADGYWTVTADGAVVAHGSAPDLRGVDGTPLNAPIVAAVATPSGEGLLLVAADGGVFALGDASFLGSAAAFPLAAPIVGVAVPADGRGYWLAAADGGVFAFGAAPLPRLGDHAGAERAIRAVAESGDGYVLVADDGGVFDLSSQPFLGSLGSTGTHGVTGDA